MCRVERKSTNSIRISPKLTQKSVWFEFQQVLHLPAAIKTLLQSISSSPTVRHIRFIGHEKGGSTTEEIENSQRHFTHLADVYGAVEARDFNTLLRDCSLRERRALKHKGSLANINNKVN
jgi:hypothetical protein